jgi:hypothetical protein
MTAPGTSTTALLVSRDLFFTSKITATAASLGITVEVVADAAALPVETGRICCIFVDLADTGLDVGGFFSQLNPEARPHVIAFGSHVATARLQAARDAGCDDVMPRSRFSASLPDLLKRYCGPPTPADQKRADRG